MVFSRQLGLRAFIALATAAQTIAIVFGVSVLLQGAPAQAVASVPYMINFQGRLSDNSGNVLSDGSYNIKFRLYDAASAGTNRWEADRVRGASDNRITVANGLFNIQFGDTSKGDPALSPSLFNTQTYATLYLEVELPTPATATCSTNGCASFTEGAMTPRQALASAAYAFNSDTLDGLDSSAFGQLGAANTFTAANVFAPTAASTVALTVKATTAGSTNGLEVFDSGGTRRAYFDASGNLNLSLTLQATASNSIDLGTSGTTFRTGYFGTSIVTPALNATAGGGTITTNAGTLQRTSSGTFTLDLNDAADTTLSVTNSGTGAANVSIEGGLTIGSGKAVTVGAAAGQSSTVSCSAGQAVTSATFTGGVLTTAPGCAAVTAGASTTLNNLGVTSINADLLPSATNTRSIGSSSLIWAHMYTADIDAQSATNTTLTVGTAATTTALTLGRSGYAVSIPGGITTSNGTINTGSGTITSTGAVTGGSFKIGANDINTGGGSPTLSNVDYLDAAQTISGAKTLSASATFSKSGGQGAIFSGTAASAGAIIQFGSVAGLSSGNANGTYLGSNPAAYTGDFINLQINNAIKLKVDNSGNTTVAGSLTLGSGAVAAFSTAGLIQSAAFDSTVTYTNLQKVGTISTGTWQGTAVGVLYGGTGQTTYTDGQLLIGNSTGNTLTKATLTGTANRLGITNGSGSITLNVDATQFPSSAGANTILKSSGANAASWVANTQTNICSDCATTTLGNVGSTSIPAALIASANNTQNLGATATAWASAFAANFDTGSVTTALTLGTSNAASIQIGKSGVAVSMPGGLTTSGGSINAGAGAISTTGAISGGTLALQNTTDSSSAFKIQNAIGTNEINVNNLTTNNNLWPNPSFEQNINGVVVHNGGAVSHDGSVPAQFGSNSLKLVTGNTANNGAEFRFPLKGGTPYNISMWMKLSATTAGNSVSIGRAENGTDTDCVTGLVLTTTWTQYTCTASFTTGTTTGQTANFYVKIANTTGITAYIDGVTLVAGSTALNYSLPGSALQVEPYYNQVTFNAGNNGEIQPWRLNPNPLNIALSRPMVASANGYMYILGGGTTTDGGTPQSTTYYAKINADGSLGSGAWTSGTTLSAATSGGHAVVVNGFIYAIGGGPSTGPIATVQYARLNSDGSMGTWNTTTALPATRYEAGITTYGGAIQVIGGNAGGTSATTLYGKVNADGTISSWTGGGALTFARQDMEAVVSNGYVYVYGGHNGTVAVASTEYAPLGSDGSIGAFTASSNMTGAQGHPLGGAINGYVYAVGGWLSTNQLNTVEYAPILGNGALGTWVNSANPLPISNATPALSGLDNHTTIVVNGYLYVIGGDNSSTLNKTIYYTSGPRLKVNGALDLTSSGGTATESGSGGTLTAGNTNIYGSLNVTDNASFNDNVAINSNLAVGGNAVVRSSSNSSQAFSVQNSNAAPIFVVDTTTTNLISNPGFETGITGWTGAGTGATATQNLTKANVYNGISSLQIGTATSGSTTATVNGFTSSLPIGNYNFSFYANSSVNVAGLSVAFTGGGGTCTPNATTIVAGGFSRYYCSVTTTGVTTAIVVTVTTNSATLYLDSFQLTSSASNPAPLLPYTIGGIQLRGVITNPVAINPSSDSATAFQVTNAAGTIGLSVNTISATNPITVQIGSSTTDTTQVDLQLDSNSNFTDTGTCATTTNQGSLYYNTNTAAVRGCVNGSWEDVVTTGGMGIIAFGVIPDSSTATNPGDLAGIGASGANSSGPCKVYLGSSTTTIRWTGCVAYSGGRKIVVAAQSTDLTVSGLATNGWRHVCLNGTNNQPTVSASAAENAGLPTFSVGAPVLCLADLSTSNTAITGIYDVRTFTTSVHTFVNISSATSLGLGNLLIPSGTNVVAPAASATANIAGVLVAWGGAATGTPNAIMTVSGPVWAKATAGTAGAVVIPSATAGRVATGASVAGPYGDLGLMRSATWSATCTGGTASTCQLSVFFDLLLR